MSRKSLSDDRAAHIHRARVYLAQARLFRERGDSFFFVLLEWAANARWEAYWCRPEQPELF